MKRHRKKETLDRILCSRAFGIAFWLRRSNWRCGCRNGAPRRRGEIWRDQIVIFMFSARAGNISLAPIHFPPYLSALIPETPPVASTDPIRSALPLPPAPSPSSNLDVIYTHHRGKGFVGPIPLRTIKIAGHVAKCPADREGGPPQRVRRAICVNI